MGPRKELSNAVEILYKIMINAAYARAATFCMIKRANLTSDFTVSQFGRSERTLWPLVKNLFHCFSYEAHSIVVYIFKKRILYRCQGYDTRVKQWYDKVIEIKIVGLIYTQSFYVFGQDQSYLI